MKIIKAVFEILELCREIVAEQKQLAAVHKAQAERLDALEIRVASLEEEIYG